MTDVTKKDPANDADTIDAVARVLYRAHDDATRLSGEPEHNFDVMAKCDVHGRPAIDGWRAVARAAIEMGARSGDPVVEAWRAADRENRRTRFLDLLDPGSTNFLGSGLSLREFMQLHSADKLAASWTLQSQEEKKRRLVAVVRLSVELEHVRETMQFATRLAELAIESVIEGDWKMVEEWAEHFSFADERDEIRIAAGEAYATFRELLLQVMRAGKEAAA